MPVGVIRVGSITDFLFSITDYF